MSKVKIEIEKSNLNQPCEYHFKEKIYYDKTINSEFKFEIKFVFQRKFNVIPFSQNKLRVRSQYLLFNLFPLLYHINTE